MPSTYILESSLILGIGYGYYLLFLRNEPRFQLHRAYLLGVIAAGFLTPIIQLPVSGISAPILEPLDLVLEEVLVGTVPSQALSWTSVFLAVYWIGVVIMATRLIWRLGKLVLLIRSHQRIASGSSTLVLTPSSVPISSFLGYIFWHEPAHLNKEQCQHILNHELCHVHQKHSWDILAIELLLLFFWFQPFLYLLRSAIHQNHEFIADQASLQHSTVRSYTQLILTQLFGQQLSLVHSFFHPTLKMRVNMLTKQHSPQRASWKYIALLPLFAVLMITVSCTQDIKSETEAIAQAKSDVIEVSPVEEVDQAPRPLNMAAVQQEVGYPKEAMKQKLEGRVLIKVLVNKEGKYERHEIVESPDEVFSDAIEQHIQKLTFEPARKDDKAVKFWVTIPFNFRLS